MKAGAARSLCLIGVALSALVPPLIVDPPTVGLVISVVFALIGLALSEHVFRYLTRNEKDE